MQNNTLDTQADQLAEAALHEPGKGPLDEPDEYAEQCDYAGCFPWLAEVMNAHPHETTIHVARFHGAPPAPTFQFSVESWRFVKRMLFNS